MFVIARAPRSRCAIAAIGPEEAGRMLNVDYIVSGSVRRAPQALIVSADLIETRTARIVWAETFDEKTDDALLCSTRSATASSPRWPTKSKWSSAIARS